MSLLPMGISRVIILGLMAMFGVEFNIVTIILSTFIFGIGDDFSIFIMDGLLSEYKTGRKMLDTHKTAIFFSPSPSWWASGADLRTPSGTHLLHRWRRSPCSASSPWCWSPTRYNPCCSGC